MVHVDPMFVLSEYVPMSQGMHDVEPGWDRVPANKQIKC